MAALLHTLAQMVGGQVVGDGQTPITGAATLRDAQPGQVTFLDRKDKAHLLIDTGASAVVVPEGFVPPGNWPLIQVADVQAAFSKIMAHFQPARPRPAMGISRAAHISATAVLGLGVEVHPFAVIEDDVVIGAGSVVHSGVHIMAGCRIGENVTIFSHAVLYERTVVGARCVLHAGASLGAYGFGYRQVKGRHELGAQFGCVELGADVEVGANTTIDRGSYGPTRIGEGTKIDNLVMIGHNCQIGRHNLICSQVGVAGSTTTGDYVVMAGQVGVADHIHIGGRSVIGAMSGVSKDVPENSRMFGAPALPERDQKILWATLSKLPEMRQQLKGLIRKMAAWDAEQGDGEHAEAAHLPDGTDT